MQVLPLNKKTNTDSYGKVIVLNGPSASGKSSIQKAFQKIMLPDLWVKLGIDNLFDEAMPDVTPENIKFWKSENTIRWIEQNTDKQGNPVTTLLLGKKGRELAFPMNSAISEYAKQGLNIIVDYIAYDQNWIIDLQQKLQGTATYWVKVVLPLEVLEQREKARETSPVGHARSHYHSVYGEIKYDFVADTSQHTAQAVAEQLVEFLNL